MKFSASSAARAKTIDKGQTIELSNPSPCAGRWIGGPGMMPGTLTNKPVLLAMKLTSILLLIACLQVHAKGFGQGTVTISVKNVMVTEVFKEIEKQTSFRFLYRDELVKKAGLVTVSVKDVSVNEVLDQCFERKPLDYKIFKETIVISEKAAAMANKGGGTGMIEPPVPTIDVTGRVLNEQGLPVEGVTVTIKGTDKYTFTNSNGEFSLNSVEQDAILLFTSINIEPFELKVSGRSEIVVTLKAKFSTLSGVEVVHTGFQDVPVERATGSFVKVNNELMNRRVSSDILSRLQGVASGLLFDNQSGNTLGISIRGRSTIYASTQPLIVVDNFPYYGNINEINPNDIENITILKDAAASSIWGARSGNGVIVITTKNGKYNQPVKVEFNSNVTVGEKPDLFYSPDFLNSSDYIDAEKFLFSKDFYSSDLDNTYSYPVLSPAVEILNQLKLGNITQAQADAQLNALRSNDIRKDYSKYFYQKSLMQQYALSVRGGTDRMTYFISAGYDRNRTNIVKNNNERISFNSHIAFKPITNLEISGQIIYTQTNDQANDLTSVSPGGRYGTLFPYGQLADENGNPLPVAKDYRLSFAENPPVSGLLDWRYYPLREVDLVNNRSKSVSNRILIGARYTLFKGLGINLKYQHQKANTDSRALNDAQSYSVRNLINQYSVIDGDAVVGRNIPIGSILVLGDGTIVSNSGRAQLDYRNNSPVHSISAIAGIEVNESKVESNQSTFYGYDPNTGTSIPVNHNVPQLLYPFGVGKIQGVPTIVPYQLDRYRSYFANASYSYNSRYTLSASARLDQSNLFGVSSNQKGIPLWSVGIKWDINDESFYKIALLPVLRLRATYGYNGNVDKSVAAVTTAVYHVGDLINNDRYALIDRPGNPELRWEKVGMLNIGLDFESKGGWLRGSLEYFQKKGVDLIGNSTVPSSTGFQAFRGNFSNMKARGVDFALTTNNLNRDFKWSTTFLFSYTKDKITKNDGLNEQLVGNPVNSLLTYRWGGLNENGDPMGYLNDTLSSDYNAIYSIVSADPKKRYYSGNASPQMFGSLLNTFSFKGFTVSANIVFKLKYYFRRSSIFYNSLFDQGIGHNDFVKRWQKPGDEAFTDVPAMVYIDYPNFITRDAFYTGSSVLIEKGDHIRLQDIRVGYTFEKRKMPKLPFSSLQFYFYANNLGVLWKANDEGLDPDFTSGFPTPKTFSFGLNAGL